MEAVQVYGIQERKEEISKWLNLPYFIAELEHDKATFSQKYYSEHSFYSHIVYDEYRGIISEAPRVDEVAINLADASAIKDKHIKRVREQCKLFNYCTARLPPKELEALRTSEYSHLDTLVYEMILDIKQATETRSKGTKQKYLNQLKKRMELLK